MHKLRLRMMCIIQVEPAGRRRFAGATALGYRIRPGGIVIKKDRISGNRLSLLDQLDRRDWQLWTITLVVLIVLGSFISFFSLWKWLRIGDAAWDEWVRTVLVVGFVGLTLVRTEETGTRIASTGCLEQCRSDGNCLCEGGDHGPGEEHENLTKGCQQ